MDQSTQKTTTKVSYAQVAEQSMFPTKEQAVIIDAIEGVPKQEYAIQIGKIIGPSNIRFISRISHGRVCLYLNNKETADKLVESHKKVNIGTHSLIIRPLISKAKRIIISNVCPIIPHQVIIDELAKANIQITSQMSFIKAGINDSQHAHILSFRRQIYIQPEDVSKLPPTLIINYDNTPYYIYLSTEKITCFICKEEGHLAKFCKNIESTSSNSSAVPTDLIQNKTVDKYNLSDNVIHKDSILSDTHSKESTPEFSLHHMDSSFAMPQSRTKRALSSSLSTNSAETNANANDSNNQSAAKIKIKVTKKAKKSKSNDDADHFQDTLTAELIPIKEFIESNQEKFPLTYEKVCKFLAATYHNTKIYETALNFTNDTADLIRMLTHIKEQPIEKNLKNRISRIIKRIDNQVNVDSSSEYSSTLDDF